MVVTFMRSTLFAFYSKPGLHVNDHSAIIISTSWTRNMRLLYALAIRALTKLPQLYRMMRPTIRGMSPRMTHSVNHNLLNITKVAKKCKPYCQIIGNSKPHCARLSLAQWGFEFF